MEGKVRGPTKYLPKEVLVGRVEKGVRSAQVVLKIQDVVGAAASVNSLLASSKVDIRQNMSYSLPGEGVAIYNAFVVLNDPKVSLEQLTEKLKLSPFVVTVQAFEESGGAIIDTLSFPVSWQGRRVVILAQSAMARMLEGIRKTLGTGGHVILYELGLDYGRELAGYFVGRLGREYLLQNYPYWLSVLSATGWGVPELTEPEDHFPDATIKLSSCIECEGRSSKEAVCSFVRGFLAGAFSELAGRRVHCEETKCAARSEGRCEFLLRSGRSVLVK